MTAARFRVYEPGHSETHTVRRAFSRRLSKWYDGWDDSFDRRFDPQTFCFSLDDPVAGPAAATCRLVFKFHEGGSYTTSMETADLSSFVLPDDDPRVCEGAGVSYTDRSCLTDLMFGVFSWAVENDVGPCYITFDAANPLTRRLFTRTLLFSLVDGGIVRYGGFTSRDTGRPTDWQVAVVDPRERAPEVLSRLRSLGSTLVYPTGRYPRLRDVPCDCLSGV